MSSAPDGRPGQSPPLESQLLPVEKCQGIVSICSKLEREIFFELASLSPVLSLFIGVWVGVGGHIPLFLCVFVCFVFILLNPNTFVSVYVYVRFVYAHVYMYKLRYR